ncbi:MAG TPA: crosslink repair DNA glycosylase YcaQ family protein [Acidimicrobiia bacterium]|nr:crosslink repair DNA glycosylase YcaQ family protein [Acidimicrobiia bacterium]
MRRLSIDRARRLAIAAQGLHRPRPDRVDVRHIQRVFDDVGLVQIDSVNVIARAHRLTLFARLGAYDSEVFRRFVEDRRGVFECWAHAASFVSIEQWPWFVHRMENTRPWRSIQTLGKEQPGYIEAVLDEVRQRGPLTISDLEDGGGTTGAWWGWKKGKVALEWLFDTGRITSAGRRNGFARVYDLTERVIPSEVLDAPQATSEQAHRAFVRRAARGLGVATVKDLADYYRVKVADTKRAIESLVAAGDLEPVAVEGWSEAAYLDPTIPIPRSVEARALLAPFDSLVWYRDRDERLFDFHYRIEIYVPEPDRVFGYYVLPFLLGDRLVGRVDLKADRQVGVLRVRGAYAEPWADRPAVAVALAAELHEMAGWLGLGDVSVERRGDLAGPLRTVV